jgi:hypothetical protein
MSNVTEDDFDPEIADLAKQAAQLGEYIGELGSESHGNGQDIRLEATLLLCSSMICRELRNLNPVRGKTRIDRLFGGNS